MGYPVSKSNSIQFVVDGQKLAFAVVLDDFSNAYFLGLFSEVQPGVWNATLFGGENGFIDWPHPVTNEKIMSYGSVANYMTAQFPLMKAKLERYVGAAYVKPDQANKPACVGYDLALDVDFDPLTLNFSLNKEPPLSHAR